MEGGQNAGNLWMGVRGKVAATQLLEQRLIRHSFLCVVAYIKIIWTTLSYFYYDAVFIATMICPFQLILMVNLSIWPMKEEWYWVKITTSLGSQNKCLGQFTFSLMVATTVVGFNYLIGVGVERYLCGAEQAVRFIRYLSRDCEAWSSEIEPWIENLLWSATVIPIITVGTIH